MERREGDRETLRRTARTAVRRRRDRASYDRQAAYAILDEALVCSVGFVADGQPFVTPMVFARWGDRLVLHGAQASRLSAQARAGAPLCVTVTLIDGLVLARSAMHHSMNYRSVVILGAAREITAEADKRLALALVVDHAVPSRARATRPPSDAELAATAVLVVDIDEASIKVRSGGPVDDEADLALEHWAGVLPLRLAAGPPIPDRAHPPSASVPPELLDYRRPAPILADMPAPPPIAPPKVASPPFLALDHIQLAMPRGGEPAARRFYGEVLGLGEVPKPPAYATHGGCWFESGEVRIHLGVEEDFRPARKAHPALRCRDYAGLLARLAKAGVEVRANDAISGLSRCHLHDPFGNLIELVG